MVKCVLYILGQLNDRDVDWLAASGKRRRLDEGTVLIREMEPIDSLYILLSGSMSVHVDGVGVVAEMGSGEIVGELTLVESVPPSATVTALTDCAVLAVPHAALKERLETDDAFGHRLYKALAMLLADRLRDRVKRVHYRGKGDLASEDILADELDEGLLDSVSLAGERFDRMLKTFEKG